MTFRVLQNIAIEAPAGIIALSIGQAIDLSEDDAIPLYKAEVIRPVGYRLYSETLQTCLWVVHTSEDSHLLRTQGVTEAIYTAEEIEKLKGMDKEVLKAVHRVKEIFPKSSIQEVVNRVN